MQKLLLLSLFVGGTATLFAQNKTLGVGIPTPSPNAALHVESPTGNQGFIMPRLTSVQREAMTSLLTDADKGLMLYDSDLYTIFIWDGVSWGNTSEFVIDNPASTVDAVQALTLGTGSAGRFTLNNTASFSHAVYAESNGDSTSAAVHGNHTGEGMGVFGRSAGSKFASAAVYGEHVGVGDAAGAFRISNSANTYSALFGETNGSGPAIYGNQIGLGRGGQFQISNAVNSQAALRGYTAGTGNVGFFTVNNAANDSSVVYSTTNGTGNVITALTTGTGSAGKFIVNNTASTMPALWAETNSNQPLSAPVYGLNTGTGDVAASFRITNAASTFPALFAESNGTGRTATFRKLAAGGTSPAVYVDSRGGHGIWSDLNATAGYAGIIQTINTANPDPALLIETIGTGPSVYAVKSTSAVSGDALYAENFVATGSAGKFAISEPANASPSVIASTEGTGAVLQVNHLNNGLAIEMTRGGLKYSVETVSIAGPIAALAALYKVTVAGTFSLPTNVAEGTFCKVFNGAGVGNDVTIDPVYVQGNPSTVTIINGNIRDFVFINGNWYENP